MTLNNTGSSANDLRPFAVNNKQVAQAWAEGRNAHNWNNTMRTDGATLWSHALRIGATLADGTKVLFFARPPLNFVSGSTSVHVGYASAHAQRLINDRLEFDRVCLEGVTDNAE